jgi:hypothetical protein
MRRTDLAAGAILAGLAVLALAWFIPARTAPAQSRLDLAPALLPSVAMAVVLAMALLLLWTRRVARPEEEHEEFGDEASGIGRQELINLALCMAAAAVTYVLLDTLGFIVAGAVLVATAMWHARMRNPWLLAGLALAVPALLDRVAWYAFTISLP